MEGKVSKNHIILDIKGDDVHYWSPQLNFRVEKDPNNPAHSIVSGLIGPKPEVWTLFTFIYFSVGTVGFFVASYGMTKILIGGKSNLVYVFPIAIIFMLTAYGTGKYGERLAKDQIEILKQFVRDAIEQES